MSSVLIILFKEKEKKILPLTQIIIWASDTFISESFNYLMTTGTNHSSMFFLRQNYNFVAFGFFSHIDTPKVTSYKGSVQMGISIVWHLTKGEKKEGRC